MKMKVYSSKRDDIIKRRDEYDAEYQRRQSEYDAQRSDYRKANLAVQQSIISQINDGLSKFKLQFDVNIVEDFNDDYDGPVYKVIVKCNEAEKFSVTSALSWTYEVKVSDDGEVIKETNSWSGLKATTREQLDSLQETLKALEYLNDLDWNKILSAKHPKYADYITVQQPDRGDRPNFEQELVEAEIEEAVGRDVMFKGKLEGGGGIVWYVFLKETPKQYTVAIIPNYRLSDYDPAELITEYKKWPTRMNKNKLYSLLDKPLVSKEV